jgi:hypothetical protein
MADVQSAKECLMKKKLIVSLLAAAALGGTGAAFADAECQAGSAYGAKPGCGGPTDAYGHVPDPRYDSRHVDPRYNNSGGPNDRGHYPWIFSEGRVLVPHAAAVIPQILGPRHAPTRRDRDGDGIANSRDRWPHDANRW